jgi:hypothetical protein
MDSILRIFIPSVRYAYSCYSHVEGVIGAGKAPPVDKDSVKPPSQGMSNSCVSEVDCWFLVLSWT